MGAHGDCPPSAVAAGRYLGVLLHRPGLYPELRANSLDCAGPLENVGSGFLSLRQSGPDEPSLPISGPPPNAINYGSLTNNLPTSVTRRIAGIVSLGAFFSKPYDLPDLVQFA
jgi:hypothetical protein